MFSYLVLFYYLVNLRTLLTNEKQFCVKIQMGMCLSKERVLKIEKLKQGVQWTKKFGNLFFFYSIIKVVFIFYHLQRGCLKYRNFVTFQFHGNFNHTFHKITNEKHFCFFIMTNLIISCFILMIFHPQQKYLYKTCKNQCHQCKLRYIK